MSEAERMLQDPDALLTDKLQELRFAVENFNKRPVLALRSGGTYRKAEAAETLTVKHGGMTIGYTITELPGHAFRRHVYVVSDGINEAGGDELESTLLAVFGVFVDHGMSPVSFYDHTTRRGLKKDTLLIEQDFMPMFWHENNPNLVAR